MLALSDPHFLLGILSAAKRGRGRGPLRSNGKVRWCSTRTRSFWCEHRNPPHPPALRAGPSLSPRCAGGEGTRDKIRECRCMLADDQLLLDHITLDATDEFRTVGLQRLHLRAARGG